MTAGFPKARIIFAICLILAVIYSVPGLSEPPASPNYPNRPITFIVPVGAGATSDLACRLISKEAEKSLGQPIIVINKPGASFTVGIAAMAAAKPDGYTIGYSGHPGMFVAPLKEKLPYHPVRDLRQIMQFGYMNIAVTVRGDSPFKDFKDIIAYARQNPKKMTYGSGGVGTFGHLVLEQIARKENVRLPTFPLKAPPRLRQPCWAITFLLGPAISAIRSWKPERSG
jgi:tripartite-type tricarboxylate transporter receptor subunit TctC